MPEDFAQPPTLMLGPGHLLRREHQELLDEPACGPVHQLVDARCRVLDQLQYRQQHLALVGKGRSHCAGEVVLPDEGQSR